MARCSVIGDTPPTHNGFPLLQLLRTPWSLILQGIGSANGLQTASPIWVPLLPTASMLPPARARGIATTRGAASARRTMATARPDRRAGPDLTGDPRSGPASARPSGGGSPPRTPRG